MGFDMNVMMELFMCPATGSPYYYTKNFEKVYDLSNLIVVPEDLRNYLNGRGHIFHAYTDYFDARDVSDVSVEEFLEQFPKWKEVKKSGYYEPDYDWSQEDHKTFKKLLKWCCKQDVNFKVSWY